MLIIIHAHHISRQQTHYKLNLAKMNSRIYLEQQLFSLILLIEQHL